MTNQNSGKKTTGGGGIAAIIIKVFSLIVSTLFKLGRLGGGNKKDTTTKK